MIKDISNSYKLAQSDITKIAASVRRVNESFVKASIAAIPILVKMKKAMDETGKVNIKENQS
jgi:hypothetical protein